MTAMEEFQKKFSWNETLSYFREFKQALIAADLQLTSLTIRDPETGKTFTGTIDKNDFTKWVFREAENAGG